MGDGLDVDLHHREEHGQARGKSLAHARLPPNGRTADARTIYLLPARVVSPTTRILPFMSRQPTVLVVTRTMCITEPTKSNYYDKRGLHPRISALCALLAGQTLSERNPDTCEDCT